MRRPAVRPLAVRLVGVALLAVVLTRIDVGATAAQLQHVAWLPLAGAFALSLPFIVLKSARWRIILRWTGSRIGAVDAFRLYAIGSLAGLATPGQLGEFAKAAGVRRAGGTLVGGVTASVGDRALDLAMLAGLSGWYAAVAAHPHGLLASAPALTAGMLAIAAAGSLAWAAANSLFGRSARAQRAGFVVTPTGSLPGFAAATTLTAVAYMLYSLRLWLLLAALGLHAQMVLYVTGMAVVSLVSLIPLTVAGIGSRDAALIVLFRHLGLPATAAVALSTLVLLLLVANALIGFVALVLPSVMRTAGDRSRGADTRARRRVSVAG